MVAATDAVWLDVLPSMKNFGPALSKGAATQGAAAGKVAGTSFGKAALAATAVIATGAVLATSALFKIGSTFQGVENTIRTGTGATGKALDALTDSAKNVGRQVPASFDDVATAIADVNTRLGLTGKPLEDMTAQFLELSRITGTDVSANIASVSRVFGDWSVATEDQADAMDYLFKVSQTTGIGVDALAQQVVTFGAPLRQLGFDFETSAAMLGKWEQEGVNANAVLAGMKIGLGQMSKAGKDPVKAMAEVADAIKNAGSAGEANMIAIETFGQRAGPDMAAAIREGRFDLDELMSTLKNSGETIMAAGEDTKDFSEHWLLFKNKVMVGLAPLAKRVFDAITTGMTWIQQNGIPAIRTFGEWVQRNSVWLLPLAAGLGTIIGLMAAWTVITRTMAIVQGALNVVLAANPIGVIVLLLAGLVAALVVAYKRSETFRNIVDGVWTAVRNVIGAVVGWFTGTAWPALKKAYDAIAGAAEWLWKKVLKPAWEGIRLAVAVAVELIKLYWNRVLKPVWKAIGEGAMQIWRNFLQPVFRFIGDAWRKLLEGIQQIWRNVLKPVFDAVGQGAQQMWRNFLQPVFRVVGDVWRKLLQGMKQVYDNVLQPLFRAFGQGVGQVRDAVRTAVSAIGRAWDGLKRAFAAPVNWVIDNVINKFLGWVNRIAEEIGVSIRLKLVPNVAWGATSSGSGGGALARNRGGIIPGQGPDRDSVLAHLTPGEFVWSRSAVDNVGASRVAQMHEAARKGERFAGEVPTAEAENSSMARGGVVGWLRNVGTSLLNKAREFLANTIRPGMEAALRLMDATVGKWGMPGNLAAGATRKIGTGVLDWLGGIEKEADARTPAVTPNGAGGLGPAARAAHQAVRDVFGFTGTIGGYARRNIAGTNTLSKHALGKAIDVMTHSNMALGQRIADYFLSNRSKFGVDNIIWNRRITNAGRGWNWGRYGGANPHIDHPHIDFYDRGGWLAPGVSQIANWTGKPEAVLTDQQWRTLRDAAVRNQQGSGDTIAFHGVREDVIVAKLERRDRLRQVSR